MDSLTSQPAELSVSLSKAAPLAGVWGTDCNLHAFPRTLERRETLGTGEEGHAHPRVSQIRWTCHEFRPRFRKLVSESHQYFLQVQQAASTDSKEADRVSLLKFSRLYRAVMKTCSMDLHQMAERRRRDGAGGEEVGAADEAQQLEWQELIWSLVEILFIDAPPGGMILNPLLEWIHQHFPTGDRRAPLILEDVASVASSDDGHAGQPEASPHFWPAVTAFLLQGQLTRAREVLALHSAHLLGADSKTPATKAALDSLDELLRKMPLFGAFIGKSVTEFDLRWQRWREECQLRLAKGVFVDAKLELLVRLLTGDEAAFASDEVLEVTSTWYHHLISKLLYMNPTVKTIDVQYHIHQAMDSYMLATEQTPSIVDGILQAAFEFDLHTVIKECCSHLSNWWMAAHLTDLLHHCGQLDAANNSVLGKPHFRCSLREHILLEYAEGLMTHSSLWQVGASYFDHCPRLGRQHLALHLERLPVDTDVKAMKVLRAMRRRGLSRQAFSLCRVLAVRATKSGRLGAALSWSVESKDAAFAGFVAERLLSVYGATGAFSHLDALDHLGADMVLNEKLAFLGKYREFHRLYEASDFSGAGRLLLSLLTAKLAPKRFWLTLLLDALPLLESAELVFGVDETFEMMHCLEELGTWKRFDGDAVEAPMEEEKTGLLRLALARNLARAMVEPVGGGDGGDEGAD